MAPFDLITSLPTSLSGSILCDWIGLKNWARLDSAYCNHAKRGHFLDLIGSKDIVSIDTLFSNRSDMFRWAMVRNVKCRQLTCQTDYDRVMLDKYLLSHERHVHVLRTSTARESLGACRHLVQLKCPLSANTCMWLKNNPNLEVLRLTSGLEDHLCNSLSDLYLPKLTQLSVIVWDTFEKSFLFGSLLSLMAATNGLRELEVESFSMKVNDSDWVAVAKCCPYLRELITNYIYISDAAMIDFTLLCPLITTLSITENDNITDEGVRGMLQNLKQLRGLNLRDCDQLTDVTLLYIGQYCAHSLVELYLGNDLMTQTAVIKLQKKCTVLRVCEWLNPSPTYGDAANNNTDSE